MKTLLLSTFIFFTNNLLQRRKKFLFFHLFLLMLLPTDCFKAEIISVAPVSYSVNDYRTIGGNAQLWSNPLIWQKFNGTSWNAAGADGLPPATASVYIFGSVDTSGTRTADKIIVESIATLTVSEATVSTTQTLVKSGGVLKLNASFTNRGSFELENNATLFINYAGASGTAPLWDGS